jgi:amidophosphoribosyltransferase
LNVEVDHVSPIPDSGRGHAEGFCLHSKLPLLEVFSKYPGFSAGGGRSYTPQSQEVRDMIAKLKLTPNVARIKGKKIVVVDDSIVRGTQLRNRVKLLRAIGAEKVYAAIAFPPLMHACKYGKTTKQDSDNVARTKKFSELKKELLLDGLVYNSCEDIAKAIGISKEQLCMECLNERLEKDFYDSRD